MSDMNPMAWLASIGSGLAQAGGNIAQGMMNSQSQRATNAMTIDLANTAVQRRQADLAKAGINPLMAGRIGGADTPTLQAPQMQGLGPAAQAIGDIPRNAFALQQQQSSIQQTQAETEHIKAEKDAAIAKALYDTTQAGLAPKLAGAEIGLKTQQIQESKTAMTLHGAQAEHETAAAKLATQQEAESLARTTTENMTRDPKIRMAQAEATSAEWKAKADIYLPDQTKADLMITKAKAAWAGALGEAEARKADALSKIAVNDLVKSGQLVDTEIAKARAQFAILTSKAGQEALATQLAQATYGANVARPYIDNILKGLQAASIGKDLIMPTASTGMSNQMYKAWGW